MKRSAGIVAVLGVLVVACSSNGGEPSASEALTGFPHHPQREGTPVEHEQDGGTAPLTSGGGGSSGNDASVGPTCIGSSMLGKLGKSRMLLGASMSDATAAATPFDFRYLYIAGGVADGNVCSSCASGCTANGLDCSNNGPTCAWWGCWQSDQAPPGQFERDFLTAAKAEGKIPMISYYTILQASGVAEGTAEATQAATNVSFMTRYLADFRFMLQQIGNTVAFVHIEPDFWGYAEKASSDPHAAAAVASANPTDCASQENSIAGMGRCMIAMTRKYAPNALVGLHASPWSTNVDVTANTSPSFDVTGPAQQTAAFLTACGADVSDFIVVEASDRDAGYYDTQGKNTWWDATNATLPSFHQDFAWMKALAEAANKPLFDWQVPVGNMSLANTTNAWHDNRVDYFFAHMNELAAAHVFAVAYGGGATGMTTPETDNGNLVGKVQSYVAGGGQTFCP